MTLTVEPADDATPVADEAGNEEATFSDRVRAILLWLNVGLLVVCTVVLVWMIRQYNFRIQASKSEGLQHVQAEAEHSIKYFTERATAWQRATADTASATDRPSAARDALAKFPIIQIVEIASDSPQPKIVTLRRATEGVVTEESSGSAPWSKQSGWQHPFELRVEGRDQLCTAFVAPAANGGGAVRIILPVERMRIVLITSSFGKDAYAVLLGGDGRFLVHPRLDDLKAGRPAIEIAEETHDDALKTVLSAAPASTPKTLENHDPITGQKTWMIYKAIDGTPFTAIYNAFVDGFLPDAAEQRHRELWISVVAALALFLLLTLLLRIHRGTTALLWAGSMLFAFVCLAEMGYVWVTTGPYPRQLSQTGALVSLAAIRNFEKGYLEYSHASAVPAPTYIPTGIFVSAVTVNYDSAVVAGYVWQKYFDDMPASLQRGLMFPDDDKNTTLTADKATYTRKDGVVTTCGWSFKVTLQQGFDYDKYPFDRQQVSVRLVHLDFDKNVILVPDVSGYDTFNPRTRPGLDEGFSVSGFDVERVFFDFKTASYNTNLGITPYVGQHHTPQLRYNIAIRREPVGPLLSNLFPLLMVLFTVFVNLMSYDKTDKPWGLYGTIAGLFFTSLVAHLKLRDLFNIHRVIYLEYFYAATYLMIVLVAVNSLLIMTHPNSWLERFRGNLLPKLTFWPLLSWLMLLVTFVMFY